MPNGIIPTDTWRRHSRIISKRRALWTLCRPTCLRECWSCRGFNDREDCKQGEEFTRNRLRWSRRCRFRQRLGAIVVDVDPERLESRVPPLLLLWQPRRKFKFAITKIQLQLLPAVFRFRTPTTTIVSLSLPTLPTRRVCDREL